MYCILLKALELFVFKFANRIKQTKIPDNMYQKPDIVLSKTPKLISISIQFR